MRKILLIVSIVVGLLLVWFWGIRNSQFLYLHDEYLLLSHSEAFNSLWVRDPINLGSANSINIIVTFFDRVFYIFFYWLGFDLHFLQLLFYGLKLVLILTLPFIGFKKLAQVYSTQSGDWSLFVLSLWYAFNPFTVVYWHVMAFPLTILLCYVLAPLALYAYHQSIFGDKRLYSKLFAVTLLFLMSFGFYLFLVFFIFLSLYTILLALFSKKIFFSLKEIITLCLLFLPYIPVFLIIPIEMMGGSVTAANATGNEAFGNLRGSLLYPFLMWYSWAIYISWVPRNIFTFSEYYRSIPVLLAPLMLYALAFSSFFAHKIKSLPIILSSIFLIFFFLMKGGQAPLGDIYTFLLSHSFIFNVFRSPDTKFSFILVLIISILILLATPIWKKKMLIPILLFIIFIQSFPLITGVAIKGENTDNSSDRIIEIPQDYYEISNLLNEKQQFGYVLTVPSTEFSYFELSDKEMHLGQDILPKISQIPFVYLSGTSGIGISAKNDIEHIIETKDFTRISEYPIRYILLRNDLIGQKLDDDYSSIATQAALVKKTKSLALYQIDNTPALMEPNQILFKQVNPTYYLTNIKSLKGNQEIVLNQSYSSNWKIVLSPERESGCSLLESNGNECLQTKQFRLLETISLLFKSKLFDQSHQVHNSYANKWQVSYDEIVRDLPDTSYTKNPDGSINISLGIIYVPQGIFYIGLLVSFAYLVIISIILLFLPRRFSQKNA